MPIFRSTIRKSRRERLRRVDRAFEIASQALFICYFLFVLATWLSERAPLQIKEVRIEGTQAVDPGAIQTVVASELARRLLWKIDRNNTVLYPSMAIRSRIMQLDPRVKEVDLAVVRGKQLTVRLHEYSPEFLWCPPGSSSKIGQPFSDSNVSTTTVVADETGGEQVVGCSFADNTGHIFAPAPDYSGTPFIIFVTTRYKEQNGAVLAPEEFNKVNIFLRTLGDLGLSPHRVEESGAHDFTIVTDRSWTIRWSTARDPQADARNLSLVLQNLSSDHMSLDTLKAIDLRFGNKVFYR